MPAPGEDDRVVEGMDEGQPARVPHLVEPVEEGRPVGVEDDLGAVSPDRLDLRARRVGRHDDDRRSIPRSRAAHATAAAWLPAETVTSPRARSASDSDRTLLSAPRGLNEPVFWKLSHLR